MINSFEELNINKNIIEGLKKDNILIPTKIQTEVIPKALLNKDIIGRSATGSGKTLAYLIPIFQKIDKERETQAIILAPTHELVMQIERDIKLLAANSNSYITALSIIGDVNIKKQIEKLKMKPNIVVGSANRVYDLIKLKKLKAHTVKTIVIDEGDRLLDVNNISKIKDVIKTTLRDRQLMLFSATVNSKTIESAKGLMKKPELIIIDDNTVLNSNISHFYITVERRDKVDALRKLIAAVEPTKSIAFINKVGEIEIATAKLQFHKVKAYAMYGKASKEERQSALESFRMGKIDLLVSSDLSARGLHIEDISHIFNLDLPEDPNEYLHRVGRTGRANKTGTAISIVTKSEVHILKTYEKKLKIKIEERNLYKGKLVEPF
ncbi:MAG: DEAD/DEAH box helicase [Clostridiaceae bacterium]